ncbi:hypothetical protein KDL01_36135 [Actinospica durhamensis]|uniref:Uncharacterized protein n=1 Tax=Actinospica durhamensis TaxID=1508375 RepID=A0A941ISP6_9ACTN|nr:hypothetical protein [Actinospica durhamensis]MBR7838754.1 hypothetical protein [Actinospica durhamensis]
MKVVLIILGAANLANSLHGIAQAYRPSKSPDDPRRRNARSRAPYLAISAVISVVLIVVVSSRN